MTNGRNSVSYNRERGLRMTEAEISQKQIEQRKYLNSLKISGKAMIAFGAWTALRVILLMLLGEKNIRAFILSTAQGMEELGETELSVVTAVFFVMIMVFCIIAFLINYVAGIGAYREGKGKKKGTVYIIVTSLLLILMIMSLVASLLSEPADPAQMSTEDAFLNEEGSFLLDLTQLLICVDILYSMIKSRKIGKELEKEQTA